MPLRWRIRNWIFREVFPQEYTNYNNVTKERDWWRSQVTDRGQDRGRMARLRLEGGMPEEDIEHILQGTFELPIIRATLAHVSAKIIVASDIATDAPREQVTTADRVIPSYTSEMRLHDAGRASAFAELLADLQGLTAAKAEEAKPKTEAEQG